MGRIYSENERKFKKKLTLLSLLFSVALPAALSIILGGTELIVYYFSGITSSGVGYIAAQVISIIKEILGFTALMLSVTVLGQSLVSFGPESSVKIIIMSFLSPVVSSLTSFITVYFCVLIGWHDYTLSMFFDRLPALLTASLISAMIMVLIVLAATVLFAIRPSMKEKSFAGDKDFIKSLKITVCTVVLIKAASMIFDTVTTDVDFTSLNSILSYIVVPIVTLIVGVVFSVISMKMLIRKTDDIVTKLNIRLGKKVGNV